MMEIKNHIFIKILLLTLSFGFHSCVGNGQKKVEKGHSLTLEETIAMNKKQVQGEQYVIKEFLEKNNIEMQSTGTGLWYVITKNGDGQPVVKDKVITMNYEVMLMDSTICYSSKESGPKVFLVGRGGVESGLEEGVLLLREGDEATFILPSHLAHGLIGDDVNIPPRAIIQYKIEVLEVKDK